MNKNSSQIFKAAKRVIPGGVNSPVRAFKAVGGIPLFIASAKDATITDEDKNTYIDYVMSWGALILGHSNKTVLNKIKKEIDKGTSYGAPTKNEVIFAKAIVGAIPSIDKLRLVNSGTEATGSAIRLARGYTKREKIIKFEGCYHGSVDSLLVKAGSGATTFGVPTSLGIGKSLAKNTIVCPYNDIKHFEAVVKKHYKDIACCIVEPICGNMGVVLPKDDFLYKLRKITRKYGIILIFDEVITGFRFCFGGVQNIFGIEPDLTCLGKIIGGGLPIGAYGGKAEIMDCLSPDGGVYQAGTLSGNPVAVTAGLATLDILKNTNYKLLADKAKQLGDSIVNRLKANNIDYTINGFGSLFTIFFTNSGKVDNFSDALKSDTKKYAKFFNFMLKEGIYFSPSQFEANFVSLKHKGSEFKKTLTAFANLKL